MYERVGPLTDEALQALIAKHYGVDGNVSAVRAGYMSTTARLDADTGRYILKVVPDGREPRAQVQLAERLSQVLLRDGIPVPAFRTALDGQRIVFEADCIFTLCEWIEGDVFTPGNGAQLASAGEMLGRIHRAGENLRSDRNIRRLTAADVAADIRDVLNAVDRTNRRAGEIEGALLAGLAAVMSEISDDLPTVILHGDYRAQNLVFDGGEVIGVLDLDAACVAPRLLDLCYALAFFQAVIANRPLCRSEMVSLLNGYRKRIFLTSEEYAQLPFWIELSLLKGLALWLRIAFVEEMNPRLEGWFGPYLDLLARGQTVGRWLCRRRR